MIVQNEQPESIDLGEKEFSVIREIRNSVIHNGVPPTIRHITNNLGYKSTYSVVVLLDRLVEAGFISKKDGKIRLLKDLESSKIHARTVNIPIVGNAACGTPLLAEQNIEAMMPVSLELAKPPYKYFLLRAVGDSMNKKGINDGDLVLVKHQETAENKDVVVALIDEEATIKEFEKSKDVILLIPHSKNKTHTPIILSEDFRIQGKVIATIPKQEI